ncbi:DNA/RNA non-specific endonuclease [Streptomyces lushanensis]|uniref:DNA/RNA non-specific endonuclease n=1 Tax=Streptomyces lushanensis TaxID=1434255 RepID=UPI000830899C|nr:DNA/RNA non-specific endonuclease [Streptomyces lushanensis]
MRVQRTAPAPAHRSGAVGRTAGAKPTHALLALQRAVGNQAVARVLKPGPPVVQRASRDDLLAALRDAVRAGAWQEVATRLNGFNDADIVRLSAGLTLGEAANTRAAVATYLAGWPQESTITAALDRGRAEVARIGRIYQAYEQGVRDADWPMVARQLHAMSTADVEARLRKLAPDELRTLCEAAPEQSARVAQLAHAAAGARGIEVPTGPGPLTVGEQVVGQAEEYLPGGEQIVDTVAPAAEGDGAAIGTRRIADGVVTMAGVVPLAEVEETASASGVFRIDKAAGVVRSLPTAGRAAALPAAARAGVGLAVKVPVVGVAFVAGLVGPFAVGWAIAHTAEVAKAQGEFGQGTSAPGGAPLSGATLPGALPLPAAGHREEKEDDDCRNCPPGTSALYGPLDEHGRATGVHATLRGRTWSGEAPYEDPVGYESGISGVEGGQHRAHLLARTLGGSGGRNNLVPFGAVQNIAMYHNVESVVETHVTLFPENCVEFSALPMYEGDSPTATAIHVFARDLCTGKVVIDELVQNRYLH